MIHGKRTEKGGPQFAPNGTDHRHQPTRRRDDWRFRLARTPSILYPRKVCVNPCHSIKRLVIARRVLFTEKAEGELAAESLTAELVYESILNAPSIFKCLRSRNPRTGATEKLYVIKGLTFDGLDIYTKGKMLTQEGVDVFYVLISSKRSTDI